MSMRNKLSVKSGGPFWVRDRIDVKLAAKAFTRLVLEGEQLQLARSLVYQSSTGRKYVL